MKAVSSQLFNTHRYAVILLKRDSAVTLYNTSNSSMYTVATSHESSNKSQSYVTPDGQSASLSRWQAPISDLRSNFFLFDSCAFVDVGRPLWRKDGSVFYNVQGTTYLHFTCYYINVYTQYIQGFCHSRLSTADHALSLVASAYEFWWSFCFMSFKIILVTATIFSSSDSITKFCHQLLYYNYYSQHTIVYRQLFIFWATDWPVACCSCYYKGTGTLEQKLFGSQHFKDWICSK
jgi:hypothetical protein